MLKSMNFPRMSLGVAGVLAWMVLLSGGCSKIQEIQQRKAEKAKKEENKKEITAKSDKIWEEAEKEKERKKNAGAENGSLMMSGQAVPVPGLTLTLGLLKSPGDINGGQEPSQLKSAPSGISSLNLSSLPIEAATNGQQLMGQMINFTEELSTNTELVSGDGKKWKFVDGFIQFVRAERNIIFISIDANVVDASGGSSDKVRVTGDLQATVVSPNQQKKVEE